MEAVRKIQHHDDARVLIVSQRGRMPLAQRCLTYEFERLIAEFDRADIVTFDHSMDGWGIRRRLFNRLGCRVASLVTGRTLHADRRYDLVFVPIQSIADLIHLGCIDRWIGGARASVCMIDELWARNIARHPYECAVLKKFDHVLLGCAGSVAPLAQVVGPRVRYLAPGIDAVSLCPWPNAPHRSIDIFAMGRRSPETHAALIDFAARTGRFYFYDTLSAYTVKDVRDHRRMLGSALKRTRCFLAYRAKVNADSQTAQQEETGFRFFEGAAAGTIMVGEAPDTAIFREQFPHEGAVIELPYGSTEVAGVFEQLDGDPNRTERIRRDNVHACLARHDWSHRWATILDVAGLDAAPNLTLRKAVIENLLRALLDAARAAA